LIVDEQHGAPFPISWWTTWDPVNPAPPVTTTRPFKLKYLV